VTTARQIMIARPVSVRASDSVAEAARRMAMRGVACLPVLSNGGRLSGMLTDRDIAVKVVAQGRDPGRTSCGDLARADVPTIGPDVPLEHALTVMTTNRVGRLAVVDGERLVGVLGAADLVRALPESAAVDRAPTRQLDALMVG
jgi:CBS domain-containing protein